MPRRLCSGRQIRKQSELQSSRERIPLETGSIVAARMCSAGCRAQTLPRAVCGGPAAASVFQCRRTDTPPLGVLVAGRVGRFAGRLDGRLDGGQDRLHRLWERSDGHRGLGQRGDLDCHRHLVDAGLDRLCRGRQRCQRRRLRRAAGGAAGGAAGRGCSGALTLKAASKATITRTIMARGPKKLGIVAGMTLRMRMAGVLKGSGSRRRSSAARFGATGVAVEALLAAIGADSGRFGASFFPRDVNALAPGRELLDCGINDLSLGVYQPPMRSLSPGPTEIVTADPVSSGKAIRIAKVAQSQWP